VFQTLANAPIEEGLINIRPTFSEIPSEDVLNNIHEFISEKYPEKKIIHQIQSKIELNIEAPSSSITNSFAGIRCESRENNFVLQLQHESFTLSKLRPYSNWGELIDESKKLWKIYCKYAKINAVKRISTRYINRFQINLPIDDFSEYLTMSPNLSPEIPQGISNFLTRYEIPTLNDEALIILTQAMEGTQNSSMNILIDIDVINNVDLDSSNEALWQKFEILRKLKNEVFFSSVTNRTLELFS